MSDDWSRVNGLWVGRSDAVTDDFFGAVTAEVGCLPADITARLSDGRVCVYAAREVTDVHRSLSEGEPEQGAPMDDDRTPHWRGRPRNETDGLYWDHCWKERGRWRPVAAVFERHWYEGGWRPWYRMGYVLRHELGHGFAQRACGATFGHSDPVFRAAYLAERRGAMSSPAAVERLGYFLGHWAVGVAEVFAEAFAAVLGPLDSDDQLFRATFPKSVAHVRSLVHGAEGGH